MEYLVEKYHGNWNKFKEVLLEWRNTPRPDSFSPTQMMTGSINEQHSQYIQLHISISVLSMKLPSHTPSKTLVHPSSISILETMSSSRTLAQSVGPRAGRSLIVTALSDHIMLRKRKGPPTCIISSFSNDVTCQLCRTTSAARMGGTATKQAQAPKQQQSPKEVGEVENSPGFRFIEIHTPSMGIGLGTVIIAVLLRGVTFILLQKCYRHCWERCAPPMANDKEQLREHI